MMNDRRKRSNEYDQIAASRLSKLNGGIPKHIALSNRASITLRNKINRLGLDGEHIESALRMIDEIGIQETLDRESIGVRFASIPQAKKKPKVWGQN
jgi:hypothetical protein